MATDSAGAYSFHSLVPGFYLNGPTYRPAHIHVKLWVAGAELLTTQLYFRDDPYNATDAFIEPGLIMDYSVDSGGGRVAEFDFVLPVS
jgi:protocatechuate 3,4-dioxygenase beta subunit